MGLMVSAPRARRQPSLWCQCGWRAGGTANKGPEEDLPPAVYPETVPPAAMPETGPPLPDLLSPAMGSEPARPEKPLHILLVSDYLPQDVDTAVHGAFQRLRRHIESLQQRGEVDVVFLWPWHPDSWNDSAGANLVALRRLWNLTGR